ncbi:MAG: GNAT family N-acetyltransferase [Lachnospiraceae bacterium]|nr:GNAT family N-acetyltransferase [Lachnospiraceae bacterium]
MKTVRIERSNRAAFNGILFEPEQAFSDAPERLGVVDDDGTPCATAIYTLEPDRMLLNTIYVVPGYRRRGAGSLLIQSLIDIGKKHGALFITSNFYHVQEGVIGLLLSFGFLITEEPGVYYFSLNEALNSDNVRKYLFDKPLKGICKAWSELNENERTQARNLLSENGYPLLRLKEPGFQHNLSFFTFNSKGRLTGLLLVFAFGTQVIVDYLLGAGNDSNFMLILFRRFIETLGAIPEHERLMITFQAENESAIGLTEKLLNEKLVETDFVCHAVLELF